MFGYAAEVSKVLASGENYNNNPLIWYTRASFGLTNFIIDFIVYVEASIPVKDSTKANRVIGIGKTIHNMVNVNVQVCYLPCVSYHLLMTDV